MTTVGKATVELADIVLSDTCARWALVLDRSGRSMSQRCVLVLDTMKKKEKNKKKEER